MIRFEFDTTDIDRLAVDVESAGPRAVDRTRHVISKTGHDSVRDMQRLAAVDTGAMRASTGVDIDPDGLGFDAGPTVRYAPFLEYGTSRMAPQPFVLPAFDRNLAPAFAALEQVVAGMLRP